MLGIRLLPRIRLQAAQGAGHEDSGLLTGELNGS